MLTLDNPAIEHKDDPIAFSTYVETYAITNGVSLIESILQYCEDANANPEDCVHLMSRSLREKIEAEAVADNLMLSSKKKVKLPFFE